MRLTALVENTGNETFRGVHGLSFYIETEKHRLLFDVGPDDTLFLNAETAGIDLKSVDTVVLSHGHGDHGGALKKFLSVNDTARVYAQKSAFEPHEIRIGPFRKDGGLDPTLKDHPRVTLLRGDAVIDDELSVFITPDQSLCPSTANRMLTENGRRDPFLHEQSLLIHEHGKTFLIAGCAHAGILNIMKKAAPERPVLCVSGFHLFNPVTGLTVRRALLQNVARGLNRYDGTVFYTCHCTGDKARAYLLSQVKNLRALRCGDVIGETDI